MNTVSTNNSSPINDSFQHVSTSDHSNDASAVYQTERTESPYSKVSSQDELAPEPVIDEVSADAMEGVLDIEREYVAAPIQLSVLEAVKATAKASDNAIDIAANIKLEPVMTPVQLSALPTNKVTDVTALAMVATAGFEVGEKGLAAAVIANQLAQPNVSKRQHNATVGTSQAISGERVDKLLGNPATAAPVASSIVSQFIPSSTSKVGQSPTAAVPISTDASTALSQPIDAPDSTASNTINSSKLIGEAHSSTSQNQSAKPSWGPLSVSSQPQTMGRELQQALGEQLKFQIDQKYRGAQLRLDPPDLGKIDLSVQIDGNRMNVVVAAANPQVKDALMQQLDRIRTDLQFHFDGAIDVSVGDQQHSQQEHGGDDHIDEQPAAIASFVDTELANKQTAAGLDLDESA